MSQQGEKYKLKNGIEVTIRPMITPGDYEKSLQFFQDLPEKDKLYLRIDVDNPKVVERRMGGGYLEKTFRLVAESEDGRLVADATLATPQQGWTSHVGDMRVIVARDFRQSGLATILYRQVFIEAVKMGLEKLEIRMMPQQEAARKCVEKLGFTEEGVLKGFAMDIKGKRQDLLIMSTNV
ncbi:GNAT family N-acetyltransferase [Acidobacteriota bacterium]